MHEFVLKFFGFLKSFMYFMRLVCVFCILMLLLYWIMNLTNAGWEWIGFIQPFLDWLLEMANNIYSISFNFFGTVFELKYLSALVILIIGNLGFKLLTFCIDLLEGVYKSAHFVCKRTEEAMMNKILKEDVRAKEVKIVKYTIIIHTQVKKKFAHQEIGVNLDEQNKIMNQFITEKLGVKPMMYQGGYMYSFTNFFKVDTVLDVLFKLINSSAPIDYAICIQVGDNLLQLNKLIELKFINKIAMASDTAYRYRFNESHRYSTSQLGIYQYEGGTLEAHEFKEIL